jgi:hypothetical protein
MAKRTQATATEPSDQIIYVGASIDRLGLQQFAVYRGGIPEHAQAAVKECPDLAELFLPIEQLNRARRDIQRQGSALRASYLNARSYFKNKG